MRALVLVALLASCAPTPTHLVDADIPLVNDPGLPPDRLAFPEMRAIEGICQPSDPLCTPRGYPRPVTAVCGDGWFSYSISQRGTCSGHDGVKEWRNKPAQ